MIHVRQLVKYYGSRLAVDHIDLHVPKGQILGILGPNGAGKTTTLRILTCFMPPTSGSVTINDHDAFKNSDLVRKSIGYLPESNPLYPEMRVDEQLHFSGRLYAMPRKQRIGRINQLVDLCGLSQIIKRPIGQLSKGNKQRTGIAQAILHDPPILILDEPTEGLDPSQITGVRGLVKNLGQTKTILLSSHILPEVEKTCDNVLIIANGAKVAEGAPDQLVKQVRSTSRIVVEVKADPQEIQNALEALPTVAKVETTTSDDWTRAAITAAEPGQDIRESLNQAIAQNNWPLRQLTHETASLEEFFIQITSPHAAPHTAA